MRAGGPNTKEPKKARMEIISIYIPEIFDTVIHKLIEAKVTPSRSEAIRTAIRDFLRDDISFMNMLKNFK